MKSRLDVLLVARGLAPTREKAQAMILAGRVEVEGRRVEKAGTPVSTDAEIRVEGPAHPYVSRGGVKLAAALDAFHLDPAGAVCLDVGASTGGFTDCLLQRGAARVYAVDVGSGQIDAKLRGDPRVILREEVNARFLSSEHVPEPVSLAAVDVSFISARLVLPPVVRRVAPGGAVVVLVKPQFEAGRAEVPRGGVVKSETTRRRVVEEVAEAARRLGLELLGSIPSPIRGASGNQEYLLAFRVRETSVSP
jgi:23S rRNA (cytidine1920-2'-O)/16S rRNA (cytidine1409-2'-O)-methyltransferase